MQPWILLDTAPVPGGTDPLRLLQRGNEYTINLGREVLMGSRMRGSEQALARLGCADLAGRADARVLIGGLGMGFTLRAALDLLADTARVTVAELVPAVVRWGRGPLAHLTDHALTDRRVTVHEGDVGRLIGVMPSGFDAVLLDVDNGPEGLTRHGNDSLYGAQGLAAAWRALRPGGVLCVWSVAPDAAFTDRLARQGFRAEAIAVRAHAGRGARHTIWVARRPGKGLAVAAEAVRRRRAPPLVS